MDFCSAVVAELQGHRIIAFDCRSLLQRQPLGSETSMLRQGLQGALSRYSCGKLFIIASAKLASSFTTAIAIGCTGVKTATFEEWWRKLIVATSSHWTNY